MEPVSRSLSVLRAQRLSRTPLKEKAESYKGLLRLIAFWKVLAKPEFPAHTLEQAVLTLKPKKVAGTAIYLSHGFYNFPGTFANH